MKPLSRKYSLNRRCECGKHITNANSTSACKPCWLRVQNRDPEFRRKAAEGQRLALTDSSAYAKKCATIAANRATAQARPEYWEMLRANAARLATYRTPETEAKRIAALIAANKRRRLDWLPDEYRDFYFRMVRNSHGCKAPEAKQIILGQIAADKRRRARQISALSPFERQERALANGAPLIANDRGPMFGEVLRAVAG